MKKLISILLSVVLLLSCISTMTFAASAAPEKLDVPGNYKLVNENANLALYIDSTAGNFGVMNVKTGTVWYSNPIDWESDTFAQGESHEELTTKVAVEYLTESYSTGTVTSLKASTITEKQGKDWIMTFYFKGKNTNFTIPVKLALKEDYLHMELMIDRIKELGNTRVLSVKLFQFFGAAGVNDTGYGLIPDGSGSLMEFNRGVLNSYEFGIDGEGQFFAPNPTEAATDKYFTNWNEPLRLPVFGMVKNSDAYLSIVESGAAVADLHAYISGFKNSYNTMFTTIHVRDTQKRRSSTGKAGSGSYYTDSLPENYIARYYFMNGEDANYIGMAEKYREYLINEQGMKKVDDSVSNTLAISLYGAVKKAKHFLGIPYTGQEALTTYKEAEELIDRLSNDKVDKVFVNYLGWASGGLETTIDPEISPNSKLGGKKALQKLIDKANSANYMLSFDMDLQAFYGGNSSVKKFKNTAYGLDSSPVAIYRDRIYAAGAKSTSDIVSQLIHPAHMHGYAVEFLANASAKNIHNYSFNSIGDTLYCAYNLQDVITRDGSEDAMMEVFKSAAEKADETGGIVNTLGGNGYAMSYVDNVLEAPVYGSHNNIALQEVPFYQIVFRGYVNLASAPVNLNSEQDDLILKLAETGMSLYYLLMDAESTAFQDTNFTASYACELDDHYDDMLTQYNRMKPLYNAVGSSEITNYQIVSDIVKITTFENGAKVYVNYGTTETTVDGVKIGAKDFTVVGGANA